MSDWPVVALGDVATFINGDRGKTYPKADDRVSHGVPFVNAGHLAGGKVRTSNMDYITPERHELLRSGHVAIGDVILCIRGSIGRAAIATADVVPAAIASSLVLLRPGDQVLPRYVLAFLEGPVGSRLIAAADNGAAQPNIGAGAVAQFSISLPPVKEQERLCAVLHAFDELIENNRRRIEILEEMARLIYREWFVHFRFPGHEDVELVDSDLGPIPEGWEVVAFSELADFVNGFAFKSSEHWLDEGLPIVKIKELKSGVTADTPRYHGEDIKKRYFISDGDVLFSWSADLNAYIWSGGPALLNQHLFVVRPHEVSKLFMFQSLRGRMDEFRARSQGTTMKHIKRDALAGVCTLIADSATRREFEDTVGPMLELQLNLTRQNRVLSEARDLLLPRLISGELDVSDLDLDLNPVA